MREATAFIKILNTKQWIDELTLTSISHLLVVFRNNPFDEKHIDHAPPQTSFYITGPNEIIR